MRYFDLHCDSITNCALEGRELYKNSLFVSLERTECFKPWVQVFAVWIPDGIRGEAAAARFDSVYSVFKSELKKNQERISFCRSGAEMKTAFEKGRNAAFLSIEGGAALCGDIGRLYDAFDKGVRMITLTWNGSCELGDGCMVKDAGGLTAFGREAVRVMAKLGMIIDVSHLSEQGFYDVAQETDRPFVASHSNARAVCPNPRNLDDGQIKEIIRRGGLIGLNLYPPFINNSGQTQLCDIVPHAGHLLSIGGEKALSLGADFDGADMPDGVSGIEDMAKLYNILTQSYNKTTAERIFFDNAYDFFVNL